jgi:hypothetical protein
LVAKGGIVVLVAVRIAKGFLAAMSSFAETALAQRREVDVQAERGVDGQLFPGPAV